MCKHQTLSIALLRLVSSIFEEKESVLVCVHFFVVCAISGCSSIELLIIITIMVMVKMCS